jgi:hypothetical protein
MAKFSVSVEHRLTRETAVDRLKGFADRIRIEFASQVTEVSEDWDDDGNVQFSFRAMGLTVEGGLETTEELIFVSGKLPFAAVPFRGVIEQTIAEKISEAIQEA